MTVNRSIRNQFLICVAIAAVVVQINTVPLYYLLFSFNQTEITRSLCEKKQAGCNGHCYLNKQIAKANAASQDARQNEQLDLLNVNFLLTTTGKLTLPVSSTIDRVAITIGSPTDGWALSLLQPPRLQA